ncbi:Cu(I)-responsive transcriptional regulator [Sphingomonas xinjiangensis]|uniref:Cu(I)-responsive transcriptional regulator n=1 Tax=Sphingomonas xinjiangensis TaxID=643568 RepID=A0A840YQU7_9SPHN|nr:Cu(I)-responsive transcriptional regulator [Sphingomonas xinjiangensis]
MPTPFVEEIEANGLSRVQPYARLRAETADTASIDLGYARGPLEASASLFASNIDGAVQLRQLSADRITLANAEELTRTRGAELLLRYRWQAVTLTGTKVETIRYYERIGLLPKPPRTSGNYRDYGQVELGRLSFVRRARDLGFSLDQVRALLGLSDDRSRDCAEIDRIAEAHLREVDRKLADLAALRRELKAVIDSCEGGCAADCRIIEALAP